MGREIRKFSIEGSVSRHNSPRDIEDDEQWDLIYSKLKAVLVEHEGIVQNLRIEESWW